MAVTDGRNTPLLSFFPSVVSLYCMFFTSFLPLGVTSRSTLQEQCGFLTGSPHSDPCKGFYLPRSSRRRGFLASLAPLRLDRASELISNPGSMFSPVAPVTAADANPEKATHVKKERGCTSSAGIPVCLHTCAKRVSGLLFHYLPIFVWKTTLFAPTVHLNSSYFN